MRVIRPNALSAAARRRPMLLAASMVATGLLAMELTLIASTTTLGAAIGAAIAAIALGIGAAWIARILRPNRSRQLTGAMAGLLGDTFDDSYTLVVAPRLAIRDAGRLDGILVGPAGVRVLTVRDWVGRYRVRGRIWEFDTRGRKGWVRCRTNPSWDANSLSEGVTRWAHDVGLPDMPIRPAVVFPRTHSQIVLEEPEDEIVTADNAPWWANSIGRVKRMDAAEAARLVQALLDAAEPVRPFEAVPAVDRRP
jgi:hypothetical protein